MNINPCQARVIDLPQVQDPRGNLSYLQPGMQAVPFGIERCYWIYDVPGGKERYGRALRSTAELVVALCGSFDVEVCAPGGEPRTFHLCQASQGLLLPPMHWREIKNFSTNAVAMCLASSLFAEADYIRDFTEFNALLP